MSGDSVVLRRNFATIQDETYSLSNLRWIAESDSVAACVYDFAWTGVIGGKPASGSGRGTSVIARTDDSWRVVHEHLSKGKLAS